MKLGGWIHNQFFHFSNIERGHFRQLNKITQKVVNEFVNFWQRNTLHFGTDPDPVVNPGSFFSTFWAFFLVIK